MSASRSQRLGASETRTQWLARVEQFIEDHHHRIASITYPPGDGVDVALICFSTILQPGDS